MRTATSFGCWHWTAGRTAKGCEWSWTARGSLIFRCTSWIPAPAKSCPGRRHVFSERQTVGMSFQVRPPSTLPVRFLNTPPHCMEKNGTSLRSSCRESPPPSRHPSDTHRARTPRRLSPSRCHPVPIRGHTPAVGYGGQNGRPSLLKSLLSTSCKLAGMQPVKSLPPRNSLIRLVRWPSRGGISPLNPLPLRFRYSRFLRSPRLGGILSLNRLSRRSSSFRLARSPRSGGYCRSTGCLQGTDIQVGEISQFVRNASC